MKIARLIKKLIKNERGAAAVEMAFVMPVFVIAGLSIADVGLYVQEEMEIKQSIRSGAQAALMGIQDEAALEQIIADSAGRGNQTSTSFGGGAVSTKVTRTCGCPSTGTVAQSCTALCPGGTAPSIYFDMNAKSTFVGILIIPTHTVNSTIRVKTR